MFLEEWWVPESDVIWESHPNENAELIVNEDHKTVSLMRCNWIWILKHYKFIHITNYETIFILLSKAFTTFYFAHLFGELTNENIGNPV